MPWFLPERNAGVEYFINSEVQKSSFRTASYRVKLLDGTEIAAKQLVVSDNASPQLFLRLIGEDRITDDMKRKARVYQFDRGELFWGTVGVKELPNYTASKDNPDVNATPRTYFAPKDLGFFEDKYQHEIFLFGLPPKCLSSQRLTAFGSQQGSAGKQSLHVEEFTCPARLFSRRNGNR